jgi:hypothetical protein
MHFKNPEKQAMHFMPIGPTSDRESSMEAMPDESVYVCFYTAYGECFSIWSGVEVNLLSVYMFLLGSSDYEAVAAVFYSTTGFRAKLDMVSAIVSSSKRVAEEDKKAWSALNEKISKYSRRRNELAHNTIFFGRLSGSGERKLFIANPQKPSEGSRLHIHDLLQIQQSFTVVKDELFSFWQQLISHAQNA